MEVELKAATQDFSLVEKKLKRLGAKFIHSERQRDDYYCPKAETAEKHSFILRVRTQGKKFFLALKKFSESQETWIEHETQIIHVTEMENILFHSKFKKFISITKKRREYKLRGITICFDEVEGLGKYVEAEKVSEDEQQTFAELEALMKSFGLTNLTKKAYVQLILEKKSPKHAVNSF